jgi:Ca2+:H+ antiporter
MPASESVDQVTKDNEVQNVQLPSNISPEDFTRAVTVATVNALRHQQTQFQTPGRVRISGVTDCEGAAAHGGHDAPSWSRTTSASVLLACTALFALIAGTCSLRKLVQLMDQSARVEILVDVVDVILEGSGIDEKFLGVTLFALVPNTTEFMNAISFALNGNIALR